MTAIPITLSFDSEALPPGPPGPSGNGLVLVGGGQGADDTPAFAAAFALLPAGGIVHCEPGKKYLIDTDLTVPRGCAIKGPFLMPGAREIFVDPVGPFGALIVNPAATIRLEDAAGLSGLVIHRKGQTFMEPDASLFAGTAVTVMGSDCFVERSAIYGFSKAIRSDGTQHAHGYHRQRFEHLYLDNVNGIEIARCADIAYISNCHAWPFTTNGSNGGYKRNGIAYNFHDKCDWAKVTNCFAYGYLIGFKIHNANSLTLLSCGADNTKTGGAPDHANSSGFLVSGTAQENRLIGCQAAAQAFAGFQINTSAGVVTHVHGCNAWLITSHGIVIQGGDGNLMGNTIRSAANGISVAVAASRVARSCNRFQAVTVPINNVAGATMIGGFDDIA